VDNWRRNRVAVTAASFVGFTGFTMVMPFLARYVQELGVTDVGDVALWSGLTLGVTPAVSVLCAPVWGRIGDRFGNKLLLMRALASSAVVMALMANAGEPWHLFALRAVRALSPATVRSLFRWRRCPLPLSRWPARSAPSRLRSELDQPWVR
jgi:DHA1 family multidrug resistance protein-like MFS transporter